MKFFTTWKNIESYLQKGKCKLRGYWNAIYQISRSYQKTLVAGIQNDTTIPGKQLGNMLQDYKGSSFI